MGKYSLAYDTRDGRQCVVFAEFDSKPSTKECVASIEKQSNLLGYTLEIKDIWYLGPVNG